MFVAARTFFGLPLTTECMISAGLRERNCKHSTEGRTGDKATITDKALHVLYTYVIGSYFI